MQIRIPGPAEELIERSDSPGRRNVKNQGGSFDKDGENERRGGGEEEKYGRVDLSGRTFSARLVSCSEAYRT